MSLVTLGSLQRMQATQLAEKMLAAQTAGLNSETSNFAVVDVRDDGTNF